MICDKVNEARYRKLFFAVVARTACNHVAIAMRLLYGMVLQYLRNHAWSAASKTLITRQRLASGRVYFFLSSSSNLDSVTVASSEISIGSTNRVN